VLCWSKPGMSNSNYLVGRKCNKNWQKGPKSVQKVLSWPNFTKYNDWICFFICFITCFSTLNCAFRITKWNYRQKIKYLICSILKILIRAAQNKKRGHQFDMPGLNQHFSTQITLWPIFSNQISPRPVFLPLPIIFSWTLVVW